MQTDTQHVDSEPGQARNDIAKHRQNGDASFTRISAPSRMQNYRVPDHYEKRSVFFWIPTPKAPPRLIGPDTAKDSADKTEQSGETDDSIHHSTERFCSCLIERLYEQAAKNVNNAQ